MSLSRSSDIGVAPLSNVLDTLGARIGRLTWLEAAGRWSFGFPTIDQLKFVTLVRGGQWVMLPDRPPHWMEEGDVCLLGRTSYSVASHLDMPPSDGAALYPDGCDLACVGGSDTIGIGGSVRFDARHADFLLDMLPDFMVVPRSSQASGAVAAVLHLIEREWQREAIGREIVGARLAEVLLVEAIRAYAKDGPSGRVGWLGALADARIGRSLRAIHEDVARNWKVADLARVAGMSRAGFAAEFTRRMRQPPLAYLRAWRLTVARTALSKGGTTVAAVAEKVGYRSQGAFAQAYRRGYGLPPSIDARPRR